MNAHFTLTYLLSLALLAWIKVGITPARAASTASWSLLGLLSVLLLVRACIRGERRAYTMVADVVALIAIVAYAALHWGAAPQGEVMAGVVLFVLSGLAFLLVLAHLVITLARAPRREDDWKREWGS
ncbi:hypothetical protein JXA12_04180 [Candidatus Woesearchaeota archaeon]|nr:hypothetical protein [Candidatus Woesearchaeota archaeon]